jgi:hypothetical protein
MRLILLEVIGRTIISILTLYSSGKLLSDQGVVNSPVLSVVGVLTLAWAALPILNVCIDAEEDKVDKQKRVVLKVKRNGN